MTNFAPVPQTIPSDTWVKATWEDFLTYADDPTLISGRFYYDNGSMRLEMSPLGSAHGRTQQEDDSAIIRWLLAMWQARD